MANLRKEGQILEIYSKFTSYNLVIHELSTGDAIHCAIFTATDSYQIS